MSPHTLCRCIDLTSVHHVVCVHVCVRYQSNTCCLMSISSGFSLQRVLNICMSVAVGGKFWHFFLSCLSSNLLLICFSLSIFVPRGVSLAVLPFLSILSFLILPLSSVSTPSSLRRYWFVLSIRSSTWIQTSPSAWLPINIKNPGAAFLLFGSKSIALMWVCAVWGANSGDCSDNCISEDFFYTEELHASIDAFLQVEWHGTSRVTADVSPPPHRPRLTSAGVVRHRSQYLWVKLWDLSPELGKQSDFSPYPRARWRNKHTYVFGVERVCVWATVQVVSGEQTKQESGLKVYEAKVRMGLR